MDNSHLDQVKDQINYTIFLYLPLHYELNKDGRR